jgi:hypothetical protein
MLKIAQKSSFNAVEKEVEEDLAIDERPLKSKSHSGLQEMFTAPQYEPRQSVWGGGEKGKRGKGRGEGEGGKGEGEGEGVENTTENQQFKGWKRLRQSLFHT